MIRRPYRCRQCGYSWHSWQDLNITCPDCGSPRVEIWERMMAVKAEE
jgi:predicted Zn-ribbon and HTH transcriptional regulator